MGFLATDSPCDAVGRGENHPRSDERPSADVSELRHPADHVLLQDDGHGGELAELRLRVLRAAAASAPGPHADGELPHWGDAVTANGDRP